MTQLKFSNRRLYAQLRPDDNGLQHLIALQALIDNGKLVAPDALHLTLIHYGKVSEMYDDISAVSGIDRTSYMAALGRFVQTIEQILPQQPLLLQPSGFDKFGPGGMSLVIRYDATSKLRMIHACLYDELSRLLRTIGITDVDTFVQDNSNLQFTRVFRPHVTIALGYETTPLPTTTLKSVYFKAMPIVY
ncbi:MAG TPA: 2'-5' RNA ligase family protein [Candidatus Saccharimonadales bacterium]